MKLAIALLIACSPRVVYRDVKPAYAAPEQPKTCLSLPPPETPRDGPCADADEHSCRDMYNARWADYGQEAARWIELYALPTCADPTKLENQ
jgi:hypothetical protein